MRISVFGTGYVGLVTGACLSDVGHHVTCVDVDTAKVDGLKNGIIPIYEPGLEEIVLRNQREGRLQFTVDAVDAVTSADVIFIAVGTPSGEDGSADLRYVLAVASSVGEAMNSYKLVVDKSTVPVGTADKVRQTISDVLASRNEKIDFDVCSNPEFLKEGAAIEDFVRPARIVVGSEPGRDRVEPLMREVYGPFCRNHDKMIFMSTRSAELTKYAANAMLATKISFMNEMANIAERVGADIEHVRLGIGSDPRIGYHFIYPGCGYGGSCFPKDVRALTSTASELGYRAPILTAVQAVNEAQKEVLFRKLENAFDGDLAGRKIAVWGLAFKPNTDDMREAPSRVLLDALWNAGATAIVYDPVASAECQRIFGDRDDLIYANDRMAAVEGADALVICTEWKEFRVVDLDALKNALKTPVLVDGRNLYDPEAMRQTGLLYFAIGRGDSLANPGGGA
ncbi:MAG: UDP-glucose/GDP-mannose dehydrogenase family protein [Alcanivoracaceae bacterium]|nr:UDP-glucose/GDP-mannose dehydrogenase family protein [Alcanivoracaceae bacterium]